MAFDLERLEKLVTPLCEARGLELVDVRYAREPGGAVLRILIDRDRPPGVPLNEGGVSVDDCKDISRDVSEALDADDFIPGAYRLEVGSPGVERPLTKLRDFDRFRGLEAKISVRTPIGDRTARKTFQGELEGVDADNVLLRDGKEVVSLGFGDIAKAHLVYRWDKKPGKRQS